MNEKKQILEMLKDGKVSVEEANQLLEALNEPNTNLTLHSEQVKKARFLHIEANDGEDKVNIKLPVSVGKIAGTMIPKILEKKNIDIGDINISELLEAIEEGQQGDIVNIKDGENDTVRIYLE